MDIIQSALYTFLTHTSILYMSPHNHKRITQYYLSLFHSTITVNLYLLSYPLKQYIDTINQNDTLVMGIHIGYFLSDAMYCSILGEWSFVFHHIFSIYYIHLNNLYETIGLMQRGMLVAETSALILNFRTIIVKHYHRKFITLELLTFILYFTLRGIISPIYFFNYIINYGLNQKQMALIAFLYWIMSLNWCYKMFLSLRKHKLQ